MAKINLQQLAKILVQKKVLSQRDAEAFLRDFFDGIVQNVTSDKVVKVKGLGTFKLIEVLDRESVNVNTGERIIIPGHSKLSFTPETSLKDIVNKPFADFQTVVINEGTSIEEMERIPEEEDDETMENPDEMADFSSEEASAETSEETPSEPETPASPEPEPQPEPEEPEHLDDLDLRPESPQPLLYGPPPVKLDEEKNRPTILDEQAEPEKTVNPDGQTQPSTFPWKLLGGILCVVLLCTISYFIGRSHSQPDTTPVVEEAEPQVEAPVEAPVPEVEYAQVPGGEYKITGTRKTYVMKPGDYVSRIAIQEYGDKDFAKYIIVHNDFPDPDNVPVDMEIKLPELEKVE